MVNYNLSDSHQHSLPYRENLLLLDIDVTLDCQGNKFHLLSHNDINIDVKYVILEA